MKNRKSKKPNPKVIKELVTHFEEDLKKTLPISIQPNGSIVYKTYLIKVVSNGNYGLHHLVGQSLIEEFYLKTSALMAARAYDRTNLTKFFEIKRLDTQYWANHTDSLVFANNIKKTKDFNRYLMLLNKLEYSTERSEHFKEQISKMFKYSFV